jgi:flagellin
MSSIMTNVSAMSALQTLRSINNDLETTQDRISTGYRVGAAKDNAAYWSIATTMRSDNKAISAVEDALGMGAAKIDTAYAGMESAIDVVTEIKAKVVAAKESGVDKGKIQEEITQLQDQLKAIAQSASFNGENMLSADVGTTSVVSGFVRGTGGAVEVTKVDYALTDNATSGTLLFTDASAGTGGILGSDQANGNAIVDFDLSSMDSDALDDLLQDVEDGLTAMTSAASKLGSISNRIELQQDFATKLNDAIEKGVGRLVDADMNEESTRLKALQTQQQLGIQALSIANSNSQNILSLFR